MFSKGQTCTEQGRTTLTGAGYLTCDSSSKGLAWRKATPAEIRSYVDGVKKETSFCFSWVTGTQTNYMTKHGVPKFTKAPVAVNQISSIVPMGAAASGPKVTPGAGTGAGAHNLPSDHASFAFPDREPVPAYAPASGLLVAVDFGTGRWLAADGSRLDDYNLNLQYTANFFLKMTHMTALSPDLAEKVGKVKDGLNPVKIQVKAGDLLGYFSGAPYLGTADFMAIDYDAVSVAPPATRAIYGPCENHSVDPFQYFAEPLRSQLRAKLPDRPAPAIGRYNYDGLGGLFGNWWAEKDLKDGREVGIPRFGFFLKNDDPSTVMVGNLGTNTADVAVGPDPAKVKVGGAPVAYELTNFSGGPDVAFETGMLLVQRLAIDQVRAEIFPNASRDTPLAFDSGAEIFYR